ncbi:hypothetical protein EBZ37_15375, partial [bacterium]|nr:hypothetical protein [bacterium]
SARGLGRDFFISLLSQIKPQQRKLLSNQQAQNLLESLHLLYQPQLIEGEPLQSISKGMNQLKKIRVLQKTLESEKSLPGTFLLTWIETQQRKMEQLLLKSPKVTDFYFSQFSENPRASLDEIWLGWRTLGEARFTALGMSELLNLQAEEVWSDQVQLSRIQLKAIHSKSFAETKKRLDEYCSLLSLRRVEEKQLKELSQEEFKKLQQPGCHRLGGAPGKTMKLDGESIVMAYDSVLRAPGINLDIRSPKIDLSAIDLSADSTRKVLTQEQISSEGTSALVVPLPMSVNLDEKLLGESNAQLVPGRKFFIFHFIAREAAPGRATHAIPQRGTSGGALVVQG